MMWNSQKLVTTKSHWTQCKWYTFSVHKWQSFMTIKKKDSKMILSILGYMYHRQNCLRVRQGTAACTSAWTQVCSEDSVWPFSSPYWILVSIRSKLWWKLMPNVAPHSCNLSTDTVCKEAKCEKFDLTKNWFVFGNIFIFILKGMPTHRLEGH